MDAKTQYQTELKRSEQEHHQPTAGAMIGHVTANLWLHQLKIEQVRLFAKGPVSLFMDQYGLRWQNQEESFFQQLNQALVVINLRLRTQLLILLWSIRSQLVVRRLFGMGNP